MVDQSELAFRLLCRRHGAQLCYTPMLHSSRFVRDSTYRAAQFQTSPADRPLVAQLCGHDPEILVAAARLLEGQVDAVDLNLGCPEKIARRGNYGSFLLREPDLVIQIVRYMTSQLTVPVMCKIRLMDSGHHLPPERRGIEGTIWLCNKLVAAGCSAICVHARDRHNKGPKTSDASWEAICEIKARVKGVPIIANGNIATAGEQSRINNCQFAPFTSFYDLQPMWVGA
jgi:tRNA-dihydrouridine synthase